MRIATTTLECYRLWSQPDQDWMPEQELVDTIMGKFVPNEKVLIGMAFDKIIQTPEKYRVAGGFRVGDYAFSNATMREAFDRINPLGIFQAKATKQYDDCLVVAKADHLLGADLTEVKTTLGTFDFDKYEASAQWRFMADIFEPARIIYHVFCLGEPCGSGECELRSVESFSLYPYAELHEDCCDLLRRFVEYVKLRGLDQFLATRESHEAAVL